MQQNVIERLEAQYGLISREQALASGMSRHAVEHCLARGTWVRVHPGVYRLAGAGGSWEQRLLALVLACGPPAAASHGAAAALLGIRGFRRSILEVTTPRARRPRSTGGVIHRWRPFPAEQLAVVSGIVTTTPARTLIDLASELAPPRLERAVDDCLSDGLVQLDDLRAAHELLASRGRKGSSIMRTLLTERGDGYVATASELEHRFLAIVRAAGLPEPVRQHSIGDSRRWIGRVDFTFPGTWVIAELDGRRHHTALLDLEADQARDSALVAAGWRPIRIRWRRLTGATASVLADLRSALQGSGNPTAPIAGGPPPAA